MMARITGPLTRVTSPIILCQVGDTTTTRRQLILPNGPQVPVEVPDGYYNIDVTNQSLEVDPVELKGDVNVDDLFRRGATGGGGNAAAPAGIVVLRGSDTIPEGTPAGTVIVRV